MILPHQTPSPGDPPEGAAGLPRDVMRSMAVMFTGFFIPFIPQVWALVLGRRILRQIGEDPERYTGAVYGYFAIGMSLAQLGLWSYVLLATLGIVPPPA